MHTLSGSSARKGFAAVAGLLAATAAGAVGLVLALIFAATVVVIGLMGSVLLFLAGLAMRARRTLRATPAATDGVIEARPVGGHSWVAYGWDNRR